MIFRIVSNVTCYLLPAYASYKALSSPYPVIAYDPQTGQATGIRSPTSAEQTRQVERWLMYWVVVGVVTGVESVAGWTISWIPFYSLGKSAFFMWLSLPQTEGSTFVYDRILAPVFAEHEKEIDKALAGARGGAVGLLGKAINWAWAKVREGMNLATLPPPSDGPPRGSGMTGHPYPYSQSYGNDGSSIHATAPQPPSLQDPASGVMQSAYSLASRYALQYLPVVATGLQAAATSARSAGLPYGAQQSEMDHHPRMEMPVPQPTPPNLVEGFHVPTGHAGVGSQTSLGREAGEATSGFSTSRSNSGESIRRTAAAAATRASGTNSSRSSCGAGSGFEEIRKEDDVIKDGSKVENGRPASARREGSWFGWNSPAQPRDKME